MLFAPESIHTKHDIENITDIIVLILHKQTYTTLLLCNRKHFVWIVIYVWVSDLNYVCNVVIEVFLKRINFYYIQYHRNSTPMHSNHILSSPSGFLHAFTLHLQSYSGYSQLETPWDLLSVIRWKIVYLLGFNLYPCQREPSSNR